MIYHNAVLLKETVDGLNIDPDGVYVDVTFGGGGHSKEILSRLSDKGRLFAFDQDKDALQNIIDDDRFVLINENFRYMNRFLKFYAIKEVDGILADLGVSSHQFDEAQRGFSIRFDADLDMRMNQDSEKSAYHVVNEYEEVDLASVLFLYGELKNARKIARRIVESRSDKAIETSFQLREILKDFLPKYKENKILAQIYQAIRIEVNEEMDVLKEFLIQSISLLKKNGRLSVISYHSLEDRLVKRIIQKGQFEGEPEKDFFGNINLPFKKVGKMIIPSEIEIKNNNRARSAKLRIAVKL